MSTHSTVERTGGGGPASMYELSYAHPQVSHLLKTIAHLENTVKVCSSVFLLCFGVVTGFQYISVIFYGSVASHEFRRVGVGGYQHIIVFVGSPRSCTS